MRLLQVSLRTLLLYSIILVLISIPLSVIAIRAILNREVDRAVALQADQFLLHIKQYEELGDLETDLEVLDQLSYNVHVKPATDNSLPPSFQTVVLYDSAEQEMRPFRQLSSNVTIKGKPYLLTVRMSLVENDDLVWAISLVQVALSVVLAAGLLFLNRSLSKKIWKPFYQTLDRLKAYELDKSESVAIEKTDIVEFDDLNKTVSNLTERNRKVYLQQKEFIENASHELQTPIAIFQSKLDTLMQSPELSQTEADTIAELEATAQRMARLNKNLLLLSKIDNEQFLETSLLDLTEMVNTQLTSLRPMAKLANIGIITSILPLQVKANRALIEILLTNLLHNAIRYGTPGEEIQIALTRQTLSITNKGAPLKMSLQNLTERFSKEGGDPNSTGLGLAIVKKICDSCFYKLEYAYENEAHTFSVTF
jgi:signal transduction histidine kinase